MKLVAGFLIALCSLLAIAGMLNSCSGPDTGPHLNTAPPVSGPFGLPGPAELSKLEALPTPEGVDGQVFMTLKSELARVLSAQGVERFVSAPPMAASSQSALSWDGGILSWYYCSTGDYNQDSLVSINDITPLGQNYLAEVLGGADCALAAVDGNGDQMITINDLTQIGQNYQARVAAYNVYASFSLLDYPADAASGNGEAQQIGSVGFEDGTTAEGERLSFSFIVMSPEPGMYFWVRPTDGSSEGMPSESCFLPFPDNELPVASLEADPLLGDIPMLVEFDASGSYDPDGEIVKYEWDWDGMENGWDWYDSGTTTTMEHTYEEIAGHYAVVRVTDDKGATCTASVLIQATSPGNDPPVAVLTVDPTSGEAPLTVNFSAAGSYDVDGEIIKYEWDWDGTGSGPWDEDTGATPTTSHEYEADNYTAWVRVTDELGGQDTASVSLSVAATSPWPMFGHDPQHTHRSPYVGAQTNNVKWSYTTGGSVRSSPAIGGDGTVYVGSNDNNLYAINPDGSLKWSYTTGGDVLSSPTIGGGGTVYVGSNDNNLYAINPDGSLKWSYATGDAVWSSPVIGVHGTIYVGCGNQSGGGDNMLYALNSNGSLKWEYTMLEVLSSPAIGADGTVYVGSTDSRLYAINPNGSLKWSYATGAMVWSSPAIGADGTVYVGSQDHKLYAIHPNGGPKWSYTAGDRMCSSPAIATDGTIYIGCFDHKLNAINPDGSLKWSYTTGDDVWPTSPAISADGTVYVGSNDNKLHAVSPDGTLKWSFTTGDDVDSSPAIGADGTVYVGSNDGKLYAFGE